MKLFLTDGILWHDINGAQLFFEEVKRDKAVINDCLRVSKVSWKFRIAAIYNFAVVYRSDSLFS